MLLLLLNHVELIADGRAILALVRVKNLLDFDHALAPIFVLVPLLALLLTRSHDLGGSTRELWDRNLLLGTLLLLDLIIVGLQIGVLSLRSEYLLRLVLDKVLVVHLYGILVVHLHLTLHITSHRFVHVHRHLILHLDLLVDLNLSSLVLMLDSRLTHGGD